MVFFDNRFKLVLKMSQKDFVHKLSQMTKYADDISPELFPESKKEFIGQIGYDRFTLLRNKSVFFHDNYRLTGRFTENDNQLSIEGFIEGYKFTMIFVVSYTLVWVAFLIYNLVLTPESSDRIIAFLFFAIIGSINFLGLKWSLTRFKKRFVQIIKNLDQVQ